MRIIVPEKVETLTKQVEDLKKQTQQLKNSLGLKLSYLMQQDPSLNTPQNTGSSSSKNIHRYTDRDETGSSTTNEQDVWQVVGEKKNRGRSKNDNPLVRKGLESRHKPLGGIESDATKIIVIGSITNTDAIKKDDTIRQEIGKKITDIIIDRITHYSDDQTNC